MDRLFTTGPMFRFEFWGALHAPFLLLYRSSFFWFALKGWPSQDWSGQETETTFGTTFLLTLAAEECHEQPRVERMRMEVDSLPVDWGVANG